MNSIKLRQSFFGFFEKRGHKIMPSSSILPTDPTVLFTTAGMQPFKEYFLGKVSPFGNRICSCQKCFRTSDIEEVGDEKHLTFLEMLGNFSFGDYFKAEAIEWALEFLIESCKLKIENFWFGYFGGEGEISEDSASKKILLDLKIPKNRICSFGKKDNFWGPTGTEGPCGPTVEIHYDLFKKACKLGKNCFPNCDCGRFVEVWNLVFNEYYQNQKGQLSPLKQKGVDTGMGLERLAMVVQKKPSVFETDLFEPLLKEITKPGNVIRPGLVRARRIVADHIKAAVFLISEGIFPSNVERGYVLRRILRRAIRFGKLLNLPQNFLIPLAQKVIEIYKNVYPELRSKEADILTVLQKEEEKFSKTLKKGLKQFGKLLKVKTTTLPPRRAPRQKSKVKSISGEEAFDLYQSYGFPLELTEELAKEKGFEVDREGFIRAQKKHQEISKAGVEKKFGGVGKEATFEATKLHTATHLLHAALRKILGSQVKQMGSDITPQRLRFDFLHSQKLTDSEIKKVEELVNQKIKENLIVKKEEMLYQEAIKSGALAFFKEKYPEKVTVYSIGDFSKEICAGPHVERSGILGHFKIVKEESSGAGVRRIRAILE